MGMFDYVDAPPVACPCGAEVSGWQSKDADCFLEHVDPRQVDRFYSTCTACGRRHEFHRFIPRDQLPFIHFIDGVSQAAQWKITQEGLTIDTRLTIDTQHHD